MEIKLLKIFDDEIRQVIHLSLQEVASKHYDAKEIESLIKQHDQNYIKDKISNDHFYGAYLNDKLVGCGCINKQGLITSVFTHPNYLHLQVATNVMNNLLQDEYTLSLTKLSLRASYDGYYLYQKLGFVSDEESFDKHGLITMHYLY